MGLRFSRLLTSFVWTRKPIRILMLGLDSAGKTTILYRLKLGEHISTVPTVGFNCDRVQYKNVTFVVWDVGGQDMLRQLWRHFFKDTQGLIFVIDSSDTQRLAEARKEIGKLLTEDTLSECPILILANKQDLPHALSGMQIADKLELKKLQNRKWFVQETCAVNGTGLFEGLEWLSQVMT